MPDRVLPLVAIVGRPNVGKSTLFNRLVGRRHAITEESPGVTRDLVYGLVEWGARRFDAVDTGGLELDAAKTGGTAKNRTVAKAMLEHAFRAVKDADVIIAVFDASEGLTGDDRDVLSRLRGSKKPIFFAANKVDSGKREELQYEFYDAGLEKVWPISAEHGRGISELLDAVVEAIPKREGEEAAASRDETVNAVPRTRVAIVGRPNVGKSSLVNRILGYERSIVSEMAGTTRDAVDTALSIDGRDYLLIDTAGIRRKARVHEKLEKFSVVKALDAIGRCDVALVIIDAIEGVADQEAKICGQIDEKGRAAVIVVNKWDLARAKGMTEADLAAKIRWEIKFMPWAKIVFVSAHTGEGMEQILPAAAAAADEYRKRTPTPKLNAWLADAIESHPPPVSGRGAVKMNFMTMGGTKPPVFVIFTNHPESIHFSYLRYLENSLRERFGYEGTPIRIVFKKKKGNPKR
ncbi:MAG TPA: ribosome biogenesis GTPase Der [bacterium]|nr:ribosome biogenesis GTPase Der [bacterium]